MSELNKFELTIDTIAKLLQENNKQMALRVAELAYGGSFTTAVEVVETIENLLKEKSYDS